jgi:general secretion pathway protein G
MGALGKSQMKTTDAQLELLATSLDTFRLDNARYLTTAEGLAALLEQPPELANWSGP